MILLETIPFHSEEGRSQTKDLGISADFGEKDLGISAVCGEKDLGILRFDAILQADTKIGDRCNDLQKKNI